MKDRAIEKKNNDTTEKSVLTPMPLPPKLERNSSLDAEPKTLSKDELKLARDEALKIINTHSKEEALEIFLAGLKPVTSSKLAKEDDVTSSDYDDE
ncbi:uncharacterized protein LOC123905158 [Trifolium pratense]|uniref:uncharacterized protein LOC123905158 n=1 Tax=Trifolium pratense TaxID=57577 RepID=UPI001E6963B5|nr:uncharacterized protein LOC123905158 [Trifolium pratense]